MNWNYLVRVLCLLIAGAFLVHASETAKSTAVAQKPLTSRVGVEEFAKCVSEGKSSLLDVRTAKEFASGHIKNAVNLDFYSTEFDLELSKLDKTKTYLVYCAGGGRSALTCKKMRDLGFSDLVDLSTGFAGWKQAKMPIEK